jgi:tRNA pseudouridine32 synthase / 23S rRNA pseudouridine746 synthase
MRAPRFPNPDPLSDHVLFIDGEAVIVNKPAGLPVATPRVPALSVELQLAELRFGFERPPSIVHRLDQDTSGCLLLARNPKAHKRFAAAFEAGEVTKRYIAIVDGIPDEEEGVIDLPLGKVSSAREGWRMVVDERGKAKLAARINCGFTRHRASACRSRVTPFMVEQGRGSCFTRRISR